MNATRHAAWRAVNSSETATETLDQQFARILAEEHDAKSVALDRVESHGDDVRGPSAQRRPLIEPLPSGPSLGMHVAVARDSGRSE